MEHLEMLCLRSDIARGEAQCTAAQRVRLAEADKLLLQQAHCFYQALQRIADLETGGDICCTCHQRSTGLSPCHTAFFPLVPLCACHLLSHERAALPLLGILHKTLKYNFKERIIRDGIAFAFSRGKECNGAPL